ncbi:hypothetical protein JCM10213v2_004598 [Rhodosporidiobolus nylandii]
MGLRVGAIFIILSTSAVGTLFPIVCRRTNLRIPESVYSAFKYFGSGVIIATAFIHLLAPAFEALGSDCLQGTWKEYDWAPAIAMSSVFGIFLVELIATRAGATFLRKRGLRPHDPHHARGNDVGHTGHGTHVDPPTPESASATGVQPMGGSAIVEEIVVPPSAGAGAEVESGGTPKLVDLGAEQADLEAAKHVEPVRGHSHGLAAGHSHGGGHGHAHGHVHDSKDDDNMVNESAMAQIMGVAILEFGVLFHSFVIGLTLAVSEQLGPLLAVLTFHQAFEGIGLGARLSALPLPRKYHLVPFFAALVYACTSPVGIAVGLGVRKTYNPDSAAASITSGVLDATSAGILLWAGLVECLAHDFVFDKRMSEASNGEVAYAVFFVLLGAGLMALLGRWA